MPEKNVNDSINNVYLKISKALSLLIEAFNEIEYIRLYHEEFEKIIREGKTNDGNTRT